MSLQQTARCGCALAAVTVVSCRTRHGITYIHGWTTHSGRQLQHGGPPVVAMLTAMSSTQHAADGGEARCGLGRHSQRPSRGSSASVTLSQAIRGVGRSGRADGLHRVDTHSQPQLCRSSSRLCRACSHEQGRLLANIFSALNYAKPPLYH